MRKISGILADTEELKKLIAEHPDCPIAVLCSEEVGCSDYAWTYASDIRFEFGEILDCEQEIYDCKIYSDRDEFEEELEEKLWEDLKPITEEELKKRLAEELKKYEPYWKDCILIYAAR